jgi:hypothetical protein
MYDILSLTNSTLITADMILLCRENPVPNSWFLFPFPQKNLYYPVGLGPPLHHLTSCTTIKSYLYMDSPLKTLISDPSLYKLCLLGVLFSVINTQKVKFEVCTEMKDVKCLLFLAKTLFCLQISIKFSNTKFH